jgi:hypothetical protein
MESGCRKIACKHAATWPFLLVSHPCLFFSLAVYKHKKSASLVSELLQRSAGKKMKPVAEIVGHIGLRCGLDPPPSLLRAADLQM